MTTTEVFSPDRLLLLGQAIDRVRAALAPAMPGVIAEVAARIERSAPDQPEERDRRTLEAAGAMLRMESRRREERAYDALEARAHRCLQAIQRAGDEARALAAIEDGETAHRALAAELGRAVRDFSGPEYVDYAVRIGSLMPGLWRSDELNPLGARTIAASILESFDGLGESPALAAALRGALLERVPPAVQAAIREVRAWLESCAVIPTAEDGGPQSAPPPRAADTIVRAAESARSLGVAPFEAERAEPRLRLAPALGPAPEIEGDAVAFARANGVEPYSRQARGAFFSAVRERLGRGGAASMQCAVVDVVAAMFEYLVDERHLPEPARALVWRLQLPAVALALMDPGYLGDARGAIRRLIENVAAIAGANPDEMAPGAELHRRLEATVRAFEAAAASLQARLAAIARQVEQEYARAAESVAELGERIERERASLESWPGTRNRRDYRKRPGREREQAVTDRVTRLLRERLERNPVPDSVREFLFNVWSRQLRTAALRDGEESAAFRFALQVVDDLLWSLEEDRARFGRGELAQRIPQLIRVLTQGVRETGARDDEYRFFFDELFLTHLRRMQRRPAGAEATSESAH